MMKKKIALILSVLLLCTACSVGGNVPADESALPEDTVSFTVGNLWPIAYTCGGMYGVNTGDAYYEYIRMGDGSSMEALVVKTDYATMKQTCVCTKEGCAHADETCDAFIKDWGRLNLMVIGDQMFQTYVGYVIDPGWDAAMEESYQKGEMTQEEYDAWKASPKPYPNSYVDVMKLDGSERRRLVEFPVTLEPQLTNGYTDGQALYVTCWDKEKADSGLPYTSLIRIDLASGEFQTMDMRYGENVETVLGNQFVFSHLESEEDLQQLQQGENWEAYTAAQQNAKMQYDAVDFAAQTRKMLYLSQRYDDTMFNMPVFMDGKKYGVSYTMNQDTGVITRSDLRCVDFAAGTNTMLMENLPNGGEYMHCTAFAAGAMPQGKETEQEYIRMSYASPSGLDTTEFFYHIPTGKLTQITQKTQLFYGQGTPATMAQTNDGRWLIGIGSTQNQNNSRYNYGLISPEDFLAGKDNYDKVEMFVPS